MQCEMCGQDVPFCKNVRVERIVMQLCSKCERFGEDVAPKTSQNKTTPTIVSQRLEKRENKPIYRDVFDTNDTSVAIVTDIAKKITQARNSKHLTKKEFAARINEKLSVVVSLERGELNPDDKLIKKLEKELGVNLREKISDVKPEKRPHNQGITLGDFIKKEN